MMKFHHVHGTAISLCDDRTQASRSEKHFCNGIVFIEQSIKLNQKICFEVVCSTVWSGAMRIGVSTQDPSKLSQQDLPKYAFPDLVKKEGFWCRSLPENYVTTGSRITLYISQSGHLQLFVNNDHKGCLLSGFPFNRNFWLFFDLYGSTKSIKFLKPVDVPKEILARGPASVKAYDEACSTGTQAVYRTRLMLVGQERVGKTSLKKSLTGQSYNKSEESTFGIDLSASCSFNMYDKSAWKLALKEGSDESSTDKKDLGYLGGPEGLEEEYYKAVAMNIVQDLLYQKRQRDGVKKKPELIRDRSLTNMGKKSNKEDKEKKNSTSQSSNKFENLGALPSDLFKEVPERVVQHVQDLIDDGLTEKVSSAKTQEQLANNKKVVMNIWDFAGQAAYYTTHQVFLTHRAVYIIVVNLSEDLHKPSSSITNKEEKLSPLEYMDFWMKLIHSHVSENTRNTLDNTTLSPPIFIVGTHRNSLAIDKEKQNMMIDEKFTEIKQFILGKSYIQHIVTPFYAVENSLPVDQKIVELRDDIEKKSFAEPYMGENLPIRWLQFEKDLSEIVENGTKFATIQQINEISNNIGLSDEKEIQTMLDFYHDLGVLVHYNEASTADNHLRNTVILDTKWLIDMFRLVICSKPIESQWNLIFDKWKKLEQFGILEDSVLDILWHDELNYKLVLIGLMEKFDLISERLVTLSLSHGKNMNSKSYYVPARISEIPKKEQIFLQDENDIVFYYNFHGFFPDGLFHRIITRVIRWSQDCGGQDPTLFKFHGRFFVDSENDVVLVKLAKLPVMKIILKRVAIEDENERYKRTSPHICAKVRNMLESVLSELKAMWMKRLFYKACFVCACGKSCLLHNVVNCQQDSCLHFLDMDECLSNKIVCCEHRRVKTKSMRKCFPEILPPTFNEPVLPIDSIDAGVGNIEKNCPNLPSWIKSAAKLLNNGDENDWVALSKLMSYKPSKIDELNEDLNPSLALLTDWVIGSGNTSLSVDMLMMYLEQMGREDILEVIRTTQESHFETPQVFISYQWDIQDDACNLRDKLERRGFSCWMDIGQMGVGDKLYSKIEEGIRNSKIVIACITPKYVVSQLCNREINLADLLKKPIIPVMFESVPWPPMGGMALVFSNLVYVNMKGVGGHGGTGMHADIEDKYKEIIQHVSLYCIPDENKCLDITSQASDLQLTESNNSSYLSNLPVLPDQHSLILSREVIPVRETHQHHQQQQPQQPRRDNWAQNRTASGVEQVPVQRCTVCVIL